jgi:hypothetical protein
MIYDEDDVLEAISGEQRIRCKVERCKNPAAWRTEPAKGGEPIAMCGWHVMYGGSKWGHERRGELVHVGRLAVASTEKHRSKTTHVPRLDPRGRLTPPDAEKYLLGVKYTTRLMRGSLGRLSHLRLVR